MEPLITQQCNERDLMLRAFKNLKKKGGTQTRGTIESHLAGLEKKWSNIEARHAKILSLKTDADSALNYFKEDFLNEAETSFLDERGQFIDALNNLDPKVDQVRKRSRRKLPPMEILPFSGKYSEWNSFKDHFTAVIAKDEDLEDFERLHYLKKFTTGDAANLLKNIPVASENYDRAWAKLTSIFDNKRNLLQQCLDDFLRVKPMTAESAHSLKYLRNAASETIETLLLLDRSEGSNDDFLVHLTIQRFDPATRRDWELSVGDGTDPLNWSKLDKFMLSRIQALERAGTSETPVSSASSKNSNNKKNSSFDHKVTAHTASKTNISACSYCQAAHFVAACEKFRACSVNNRYDFVVDKQLCFNCLGAHRVADCRSKKNCNVCQGRHHTLIHRQQAPKPPSGPVTNGATSPDATQGISSHATKAAVYQQHSVMLATARVNLSTDHRNQVAARALIDPCSEASFITERMAQRLRLARKSVLVPISGLSGALCNTAKSQATVTISSRLENNKSWEVTALILPRLTDYLPPPKLVNTHIAFAEGLPLADPRFDSLDAFDILIGADVYTRIIEAGLRKSPDECTIVQATGLGWIITGAATLTSTNNTTSETPLPITSMQCLIDGNFSSLLERFWIQEEATKMSVPMSKEEAECEAHFSETCKRTESGRYVLRLPFRLNVTSLGNSEFAAKSMLYRMEKLFAEQPQFREKYTSFLDDYLSEGHMKETLPNDTDFQQPEFFLPHHGVFKTHGDTSKLRVVFNGSVKLRQGLSLNNCLYTGPKLQMDIFDILLRWRTHRFVFSADIKQMFRQILIDPEDQRYQQILWRRSPDQPIRAFSLCTVTYGLASSPYQAIRTLRQLALDEGSQFPHAAQILKENIYVDDILAGADTLDEANQLRDELTKLLMAGGFPLSKWTANHPSILSDIAVNHLASSQHRTWEYLDSFTMLGISWRPSDDAFYFHFDPSHMPEKITKRKSLSLIAQLYDPLGWITPIIVSFKIFMQTLWHTGLQWDDLLPPTLRDKWDRLFEPLKQLQSFSVPRWTGILANHERIELHGFSDASERAYAACLYARTINDKGQINSILLAAKSKVAPLKQVSLPRLELSGALLLVRLTKRIQDVLALQDVSCHLWCDSTITLSWIREHPATWKTYVANRVSEIQTTLPNACWHHVAGKENPADCASRGISPQELISSPLWLHGPSFLFSTTTNWTSDTDYAYQGDCQERKGTSVHTLLTQPSESELLLRFSCLDKLLRITSRCFEFIQKLRDRRQQNINKQEAAAQDQIKALTPAQLDSAFKFWIKSVQTLHFQGEINSLSRKQSLSSKSCLIRLNPFLDADGLLRVGGRLRHSLLHPDEAHPMILPRESFLSQLVVRDAHQSTLHGGTQLTLSNVRQRIWIVRGRQLVRSVILKCLRCYRLRASPTSQLMGDLPSRRVRQCRPFLHVGVDYAGPINLRLSKGRGTRSYKGYIAVFVCLSTRAVHLEVASGYSTGDFLNVYRRFVARRGICASISSDCGTNFIGANKELRLLFSQANAQSAEIARLLSKDGTEWKFNPPAAPHFGGIWEAAVKSVKFHLKRVIGEALLTFEEMTTLLTQIEACLNSRPLCPLRDDPTDLSALTPAHFLIGQSTLTVPEPSTLDISASRLSRWQLLRQMYEHFWHRWSSEYLHELQQRPRWRTRLPEPKIGDLCLVRFELQPPCKWPLARITQVRPGADGLTRVVHLKTASTSLVRPISKISLLPSNEDNSPATGEGGRNVPEL